MYLLYIVCALFFWGNKLTFLFTFQNGKIFDAEALRRKADRTHNDIVTVTDRHLAFVSCSFVSVENWWYHAPRPVQLVKWNLLVEMSAYFPRTGKCFCRIGGLEPQFWDVFNENVIWLLIFHLLQIQRLQEEHQFEGEDYWQLQTIGVIISGLSETVQARYAHSQNLSRHKVLYSRMINVSFVCYGNSTVLPLTEYRQKDDKMRLRCQGIPMAIIWLPYVT